MVLARVGEVARPGNASDELNAQNIQNHLDPYTDVQFGPSGRTDARHRVTVSAVWQAPWGITVAPIFRFRSALPVNLTRRPRPQRERRRRTTSPTRRSASTGSTTTATRELKEIGACETINCGRGASQQAFNLRVSKGFRLLGTARIEAIAEIFNLFNAMNPARRSPAAGSTRRRRAPDPNFLQPTEFAGDFQNPEQRVGQIGFRFTF